MSISKGTIRAWSRLGQRATFFANAIPEIADDNKDMIVLTADLAQLSNLERFALSHPQNFLNVGIAEQNMIGIAAGLAMEGRLVYATTYASFLAVRDLEHIRQHISNMRLNVKLIGTAAGVVAARSGIAHWATEDIAFMRALPNMKIISVADSVQAYHVARYSATYDGPMYIRLSGVPGSPIVYDESYEFIPDKIKVLREGDGSVAILGTGLMVAEAIDTARLLEDKGISATVCDVHTIKPMDTETLDTIFDNYELIVTMEEHSVIGGVGSAVAEYKTTKAEMPKQLFLGFPDSFNKAGTSRYIWESFGLTSEKMAERITSELTNR